MYSIGPVRGDVVGMGAGFICGGDAYGGTAAVQGHLVEVLLRGILRGSVEIEQPAAPVYAGQVDDVVIPFRHQALSAAVAVQAVDVAPAVLFRGPQELPAFSDPVPARAVVLPEIVDVYPGRVPFGIDVPGAAGADIHQEEAAAVLLAVELLHHEFVAVAGPFHAGQVMLHRVTGDMHPAGAGGGHIDHADAGRGRIVAHFGILHRDDIGVYRIGGVEHQVVADGRGVDLPVGDGAPVGA